MSDAYLHYSAPVRQALVAGTPLVALETAVLSFGLPYPENVRVFREMEKGVRESGAVPAAIALDAGQVLIGLEDAVVERLAQSREVLKTGRREIGPVLATGKSGATTVSSTLWLAHRAGIPVFATGGTGGVHPGETGDLDVSADLMALATIPQIIVSTGVKSICDAAMTAELLESFSVPVLGYRTDRFPHFYGGDSQCAVMRVDDVHQIVRSYQAHRAIGGQASIFVANPVPPEHKLDPDYLRDLTTAAAAEAHAQGVRGAALTPFLLSHLAKASGGRTIAANEALLVNNARVAGQIAAELARR
jgi:pseudouridine-5'-phosphate glycosidase